MKRIFSLTLLIGIACSARVLAADKALDPQLIAKCESCHGPHGNSVSATVPRLNGQQSAYLSLRLKEFLDPARSTPHATYQMWETATNLGDRIAQDLAQYFASQTPTPAAPAGSLAAKGEKIYREGIGSDVPACQSCHGASGEGQGMVPRVAGQHGEYFEQQMNSFMLQVRVSSEMNRHTWHMEPDQFQALRAYLSNDR